MPILLLLVFIAGILILNKGIFHYLRGKGYRFEDAYAIASQAGAPWRVEGFIEARKRGPVLRNNMKELRKGILTMLVGITISLLSLYVLISNYTASNH